NALMNTTIESMHQLIESPIETLEIEFGNGSTIALNRKDAFDGAYTLSTDDADHQAHTSLLVEPGDFAGRLHKRAWEAREDFTKYIARAKALSSGAEFMGDDRMTPDIQEDRYPFDTRAGQKEFRANLGVRSLLDNVERMFSQSAFISLSRDAQVGVYSEITRTTLEGSQSLTSA